MSSPFALHSIGAALLLAGAASASAQNSRITQVTVYPGAALVERTLRVAAGARQVELACLPASLDVATLQVEGSEGLRVGPASVLSRRRSDVPACQTSPDDRRIRELEDQIAALQAESEAQEMVLGYLKNQGAEPPRGVAGAVPGAPPIAATAEAIRRAAQEASLARHRLTRQKEPLEQQLKELVAERDRLRTPNDMVQTLTLPVQATRDGELRLRHVVRGPTWGPSYRATLDADRGSVLMQRQAQVRQQTGEDWRGVGLRLSTAQPGAAAEVRTPGSWTFAIRPPVATVDAQRGFQPAAAASPAPMAMRVTQDRERDDFAPVQAEQGAFATEFVPGAAVDIRSGNEAVRLDLGEETWQARVLRRVNPQQDAAAYVVAEIAAPAGVWPAGPMQLWRGGQAAGQVMWRSGARERVELPFGRDDRVRVQVNPVTQATGSGGFIGSRQERRIGRAYVVENRHTQPIELQLLEAAPLSTDERIEVSLRFVPEPSLRDWQERRGVMAWEQRLAAGQTFRLSADYVISHPRDTTLVESR